MGQYVNITNMKLKVFCVFTQYYHFISLQIGTNNVCPKVLVLEAERENYKVLKCLLKVGELCRGLSELHESYNPRVILDMGDM